MPPRRSSRATSAKPAEKPAEKPLAKVAEKPTMKPRAQTTKKRAASPERTPSPPPKRSRTASQKSENGVPAPKRRQTSKPPSKTAAPKKATEPALAAKKPRNKLTPVPETQAPVVPAIQVKPYFNPLPTPPEKRRPGLLLWAWGAGNFGQFGMGVDVLGELDKPKRNIWVEEQIEEGTFGEEGAGLESIAAGGLHSILIDEKGKVWTCGVNDDAALGRITHNVPDPKKPGSFLDIDELTSVPHPLESLVEQNFRAVQVATGDSICAALSTEGELRVWGSFRVNEGSLGFSNGLKHQFLPVPILELSHKPGDTEKAQLGRKVLERRKIHGTVPEKVTLGTRGRKAVKIGAGSFHSFAVDDKGDTWGWGLNSMGQTGTGWESSADAVVQLPQKIEVLARRHLEGTLSFKLLAETTIHCFDRAGKVFACGRSNAGQLGLPDDHEAFKDRVDPDFVPKPILVPFPDDDDPVVRISSGPHNNMAITREGALYAWGQGTQGELDTQAIVRREGGSWAAVDVACGGQHTLGLFRKK
ncbi:regulator of chromosome condensation 1/beta-lactamase-inhibitor protein II [Infundibulicybe gibba]|nr:regulator of chromosome condensation 1/beta-lactamase-inhibitor protein II [Infundibulicybe gibba]